MGLLYPDVSGFVKTALAESLEVLVLDKPAPFDLKCPDLARPAKLDHPVSIQTQEQGDLSGSEHGREYTLRLLGHLEERQMTEEEAKDDEPIIVYLHSQAGHPPIAGRACRGRWFGPLPGPAPGRSPTTRPSWTA